MLEGFWGIMILPVAFDLSSSLQQRNAGALC